MQFRLTAGTHVGPDMKNVERMWRAGIPGQDVIDTNQDLSTLNARGFPPKFQPLTPTGVTDRATLLAEKARIEALLAQPDATVPGATAPRSDGLPEGPPTAPPQIQDPRGTVNKAQHPNSRAIVDAVSHMTDAELREWAAGEEIELPAGATHAEMVEQVRAIYS
jgi:hypothetical protein